MNAVWTVIVAALLALAADAYADTVYLKDGQSVWGREVTEEADTVVVVRPSGTLRFPKRDVSRIERWRLSVPNHYEPPTAGASTIGERPASNQPPAPAAGLPAPAAGTPVPAQAPAVATPPTGTTPAVAAPAQPAPTLLPPAPPPGADKPR